MPVSALPNGQVRRAWCDINPTNFGRFSIASPLYERKRLDSVEIQFVPCLSMHHGGRVAVVFDCDGSSASPLLTPTTDAVSTFLGSYASPSPNVMHVAALELGKHVLRPKLDTAIRMPSDIWTTDETTTSIASGFGSGMTPKIIYMTYGVEGYDAMTVIGHLTIVVTMTLFQKRAIPCSAPTAEELNQTGPLGVADLMAGEQE